MVNQTFASISFRAFPLVATFENEVNPTFTWSDEHSSYLKGSPIVATTQSLQNKLKLQYDALLAGDDDLCNRYTDCFPSQYLTFTMLFSNAIRIFYL